MPCSGNNCDWTFMGYDEMGNPIYACEDGGQGTCATGFSFLTPEASSETDLATLSDAVDLIKQMADDIVGKIPPKCISGKLGYPGFILTDGAKPVSGGGIFLEMADSFSINLQSIVEGADGPNDTTLADAAREINVRAADILAGIPDENGMHAAFVSKINDCSIRLVWIWQGETC